MNVIAISVKPILEEMGLYDGAEISVKEAFEIFLEIYPKGIGPFGTFMCLVQDGLGLRVREVIDEDKIDYLFSYVPNPKKNYLNYDPRKNADYASTPIG